MLVFCPHCGKSYDLPDSLVAPTEESPGEAAVAIPSHESPIQPSAVYDANGVVSEEFTPVIPAVIQRPTALSVMLVMIETLASILSLGALYYIVMSLLSSPPSGEPNVMAAIYVPIGLFMLIPNALTFVVCHFLRRGFNWARVMILIIMSIAAVLSLFALMASAFVPLVVVVLFAVVFIYILVAKETREYCNK